MPTTRRRRESRIDEEEHGNKEHGKPPGSQGQQGHTEKPQNPALGQKQPPPNGQHKQFGNGIPGNNPNAFKKPNPNFPPKPPVVNNTVKIPPTLPQREAAELRKQVRW